MRILSAPLQGYTEAPFRHFHAEVYGHCNGAADTYYTPFIRIEHNDVRSHDIRDLLSTLNANHCVIPQIIVRDCSEFAFLTDTIVKAGYKTIDINMGCPFPPQVNKGRGAALVSRTEILSEICRKMKVLNSDGITFSAKMRLGVNSQEEWRDSIKILNEMPLSHITIHPRIARQQYSGELILDELTAFIDNTSHPIVFNGDIRTPEDIDRIINKFPSLYAIMVGRGLLARPSIIAEWKSGKIWSKAEKITHIQALHEGIKDHYINALCGQTQILSKLKPFWEYLESEIGHKTFKAIRKATTLSKYDSAILAIGT